ncbi:glycine cleavage system aminomethyltransferase GcvT [Candidatus Poribacteria bacterium]|nr:glycine cleavage system aminomethyltransferase GcvT [Candidatus Poribacteria bacterium]MYH82847.1 glycine cleavage system aminomethyltransferase GcvT [Candidatus Poribacteria bacterium]MYK95565.1 glycine cleavage system aminomethyltransferase GcvT [Candidatus Poribacteria bacterium]
MKRTPLYQVHETLNAKFTEFGGWEMPLQYSSIVKEHLAVRSTVGLFDLSHMGEFEVHGQGANELVQKLSTNDVGRLTDGRVLYTLFCNETGGLVDDLLIYRHADNHYMLVVNAANIKKDFAWVETHNDTGAEIKDVSGNTALIALQGPKAIDILNPFVPERDVSEISFFRFVVDEVAGIPTTISRTGYTGETGFELYVNANRAEGLWNALYPIVIEADGQPVGLGARDTLRLEAGLRLYGVDMNDDTNPYEVGLSKFVKSKGRQFIGKGALLTQKKKGIAKQMIGFQMLDRAVARTGYAVYQEGEHIGSVTSGAPSPSLKCSIGFALVTSQTISEDDKIDIEIRSRMHPAKIVKVPFI